VWNNAGTWEERDVTQWAKDELTAMLQATCVNSGGVDVKITDVRFVGTAEVYATKRMASSPP
jgi:activator of HSP90 ATPase